MAHDRLIADRLRRLLAGRRVTEQRMFGGVGFMVRGNLAIAASGHGGILVRVDPADSERLCAGGAASPMQMRGRQMRGWVRVPAEHVRTARALARWAEIGIAFAMSLPVKTRRERG